MHPFLSHLHSELRKARLTRRGATHDPDAVATGQHKKYARMDQTPLPPPVELELKLTTALGTRESYFKGSVAAPLSLPELGTLLGASLGIRRNSLRRYPSGGSLYPVETYLLTNAVGAKTALFHYNPTDHSLEKLWDVPSGVSLKSLARKPDDLLFSTMIIFTGLWSRSAAKYGDLSYQHTLLEAGHMSQNILLTSTALGLKSRPYAGFDDDKLIELLDLNSIQEQPVHTIVLSR